MYTSPMPLRTAIHGQEFPSKTVVIDWSSTPVSAHADGADGEVERLVRWVKEYPRRSAIHVVLRSAVADRLSRRLQSRLLSLGCRVTVRTALVSRAQDDRPAGQGWEADFGVPRTVRASPLLLTT